MTHHIERHGLASGKRSHSYGKSASSKGKSTINGPCSVAMSAMFLYQRAIPDLLTSMRVYLGEHGEFNDNSRE